MNFFRKQNFEIFFEFFFDKKYENTGTIFASSYEKTIITFNLTVKLTKYWSRDQTRKKSKPQGPNPMKKKYKD